MSVNLPGSTCGFWQLVIGAVENEKTDVALLNAFEAFVNVSLPNRQPFHNRAILVLCRNRGDIEINMQRDAV